MQQSLTTAQARRIALAAQGFLDKPHTSPTISWPDIWSDPEVGGSIMVTRRARVDLPQPDSPTTASV